MDEQILFNFKSSLEGQIERDRLDDSFHNSYRNEQRINKESVSTNAGGEIISCSILPYNLNNNQADNHSGKTNKVQDIKKTKLINKQKPPKPSFLPSTKSLMKNQQILTTLRNITKNIKSQLCIKKQKHQFIKQENGMGKITQISPQKILNKLTIQQPQINISQKQGITQFVSEGEIKDDNNLRVQNKASSKHQKTSKIKDDQSFQVPFIPINKQDQINLNTILRNETYCINSTDHSYRDQQLLKLKQRRQHLEDQQSAQQQKIILFSKHKNQYESFPVYQQQILTDKKQLREIKIQREMDNDIDSEDEQIQMGVGYLYFELASSCKKNNKLVKMANLMKSKSIAKSNLKNNTKKKQNMQMTKLDSVRQRLVFN